MNITSQRVAELAVHPIVARVPMLPADSPEALAIRNSIAVEGVLEPLKTHGGKVIDGRERLRACQTLAVETVDCIELGAWDVHTVALHSLAARKHLTKSAVAYLAYPHLEPLMSAPGKAKSPPNALSGSQTAEALAEQLGISRSLFFLARNIHGHFAKHAELRKKFEPLILVGVANPDAPDQREFYSLQRVKEGIADALATAPEKSRRASPEVREHVIQQVRKAAAAIPRELREAIAERMAESLNSSSNSVI